jgi:hypothetical protein
MYGFRKCSLFARIAPGKASTLVGTFPRIKRRKARVLLFPRMPSVIVDHSSHSVWHGKSNGHGTTQETDA